MARMWLTMDRRREQEVSREETKNKPFRAFYVLVVRLLRVFERHFVRNRV